MCCHLATITSADEQALINSQLPALSGLLGTQDYWIGGKQLSEYFAEPGGNWQWINEEGANYFWNGGPTDMYANWGSLLTCPTCLNQPEPNNLGGENHLTVDNRFLWGWNDLNNSNLTTEGYITEGTAGQCLPPPPCMIVYSRRGLRFHRGAVSQSQ